MRVLVTRPEPGAAKTAERLRTLGAEPVLLPLTRIVQLQPEWPAGKFDAVVATSMNAFLSATLLPEIWRGLPVHTVGARTAEAAQRAGFSRNGHSAADTNGLLAHLSGNCARGSRLVYLCGRVRRPDLEKGLEARGHFVSPVETYDTVSVSYLTDNIREISGGLPLNGCVVMSGEAALALAPHLRNPELGDLFENTRFYCISGRVAEALEPLAAKRVLVAEAPDEEAILRLVGQHIAASA